MNRERQIEELAEFIAKWLASKRPLKERLADALYAAGYRKLSEPPPVLTDRELCKAKFLYDSSPDEIERRRAIDPPDRRIAQLARDACFKVLRGE